MRWNQERCRVGALDVNPAPQLLRNASSVSMDPCLDLFTMLSHRKIELIVPLKVHPVLWRGSLPGGEPKRRIGGDAAPSSNDLAQPVLGDVQGLRELIRGQANILEIERDLLSGVNWLLAHASLRLLYRPAEESEQEYQEKPLA